MSSLSNQLQGNWAEQYIASELASQGCFIRHVTQGHDSGVDLYCETTYDGQPFLHFWCQVKSKQSWKGKKDKIIFSPEPRHVEYWLKQPVPVFVFLVPASRDKRPLYYICTPLDLANKKMTSFLKVNGPKGLSMFLHHHLRSITQLWDLKEGKVSSLKMPRRTSFMEFPPGSTLRYKKESLMDYAGPCGV